MQRPVLACCTDFVLDRAGRARTITLSLTREKFRDEILLGCRVSPGTTLLVERHVFDEIGGFDESLRRFEDWDWLLRYVQKYDMEFVPVPLARIYAHPPNVASAVDVCDAVLAAISQLERKHRNAVSARGLRSMHRFRSALLIEKGSRHYHIGQPFRAAACVISALVLYPARSCQLFGSLARASLALTKRRGDTMRIK
jgi:hypothetical protein